MRLFKLAGVRRPLDNKFKIDMILGFMSKNGLMLDRHVDSVIRTSITDVRIMTYYVNHNQYKQLREASKLGLGIRIHVSTGRKKKEGLPRKQMNPKSINKKPRKSPDIFKKEGETPKKRMSELLEESRASLGTKKPSQWLKIVSVPMGGQNKKY